MWTSVVALAALSTPAAEPGSLTLSNVRATYGVLGPVRADHRVLPGDRYVLTFDVEGVRLGPDGKVSYSIATEVRNAAGRIQYQREPKPVEAPTSLGGDRVTAHASLHVGLDTPPGALTFKVTVADRNTGASASLTRELDILPAGFGLVRLSITNDPRGELPAAVLGVGQAAWLQLGAVGFARDGKQPPAVSFALRFLDAEGKPTHDKPTEVPAPTNFEPTATMVPVQFPLTLNRPGKFTAEITATDAATGKTATLSVPFTVVESK
jgi:hypothetical protein